MKFVHIADMHFDVPFTTLNKKELGNIRRLDQRKALKKVVDYIKQNNIQYLFIAGDLYEHEYVKQSTIEYINNLFKEIGNTKIYIIPGNHDPILKNSYYSKFKWNKNVHIFSANIEKIQEDEADIYGFGFDNFYMKESKYQDLQIENKEKINILITHATLDAGNNVEKNYNILSSKKLKEKNFDYIALGHIHKLDFNTEEQQRIAYPGSTVSLGFDEPGKHGMIVGELEKENINLTFVPLDEEQFVKENIDVTNMFSKEELIENINELEIKEDEYVELLLIGNRNFEIDKYTILKYIDNQRIIKIKDQTEIAYDLEKLSNTTTLKGLFVKKMLEKSQNKNISKDEKNIIEKAIEIGLEALE